MSVPVPKRAANRVRRRGGTTSHRLYTPFPADRRERRQFRAKVRSYFVNDGDARKWDAAEQAAAIRGLIVRVLTWADQQPSLIQEGRLLPVLGKEFGTLISNWRRMVELLQAMDAEPDESLPSLAEYLARQRQPQPASATNANGGDSRTIDATEGAADALDASPNVPSARPGMATSEDDR